MIDRFSMALVAIEAISILVAGPMTFAPLASFPPIEVSPAIDPSDMDGREPSVVTVKANLTDISLGLDGYFIENAGQVASQDIRFYTRTPDGWVTFQADGVRLTPAHFPTPSFGPVDGEEVPHTIWPTCDGDSRGLGPDSNVGIRWTFKGANAVEVAGVGPSAFPSIYPQRGFQGIGHYMASTFTRVRYMALYDGIDLEYGLSQGTLKYQFILNPGADPSAIAMTVEGQEAIEVDGDRLVMRTPYGEVVDGGLSAFYGDGSHESIPCRFNLKAIGTYGFSLGSHDAGRTVVIDPIVYSTFLGGADSDRCRGVAIDAAGSAFIVGSTDSSGFPYPPGICLSADEVYYTSGYVLKLSPDGSHILFRTFIACEPVAVALDKNGNPYITGTTGDPDFPTSSNAFQTELKGNQDAFICKLSGSNGTILFSTMLGGDSNYERPKSIALDPKGRSYVVGSAPSDFPTTSGAFQKSSRGDDDAFIVKLNEDGSKLLYSTFVGGSRLDEGTGIAIDAQDCAYVVGTTYSTDFPFAPLAFQWNNAGYSDAFVLKMGQDGDALVYCSYLGGSYYERGYDVTVDREGYAYVAGASWSTDFPATNGSYQKGDSPGDAFDVFITKISVDGHSIEWSTYLGGGDDDWAYAIELTGDGCVCVAGRTASEDFPTTPENPSHTTVTDPGQVFVARLDADGSRLEFAMVLGGIHEDWLYEMALDGRSNVYLTGDTASEMYPTTADAFDPTINGIWDVFVTKVSMDLEPPIARAGEDIRIDQHQTAQFDGSGSTDNSLLVNWTWRISYVDRDIMLFGPRPVFRFDEAGEFNVNLTVRDEAGNRAMDALVVMVRDTTLPVADAGPDQAVIQHQLVQLDGTRSRDNVGVVSWTWRSTSLDISLTGPRPSMVFDEAGIFEIHLGVGDAEGNVDWDSTIITVRDTTPPYVVLPSATVVDQHSDVLFDGTLSTDNVGIANWTWTLIYDNREVRLEGQTVTFTFDLTGTYQVTLGARDGAMNYASGTMYITVLDTTPPVADAGPDVLMDQHRTVTLNGTRSHDDTAIVHWSWTLTCRGQALQMAGPVRSLVIDDPGMYNVSLVVVDAAGNWAIDWLCVRAHDIEPPLADAGEDQTVEARQQICLDGLCSSDNVDIVSWTWTIALDDQTLRYEGGTPNLTIERPGVYNVTLLVQDAEGNRDLDYCSIEVVKRPEPTAGPFELPTSWGWGTILLVLVLVSIAVGGWMFVRRRGGH